MERINHIYLNLVSFLDFLGHSISKKIETLSRFHYSETQISQMNRIYLPVVEKLSVPTLHTVIDTIKKKTNDFQFVAISAMLSDDVRFLLENRYELKRSIIYGMDLQAKEQYEQNENCFKVESKDELEKWFESAAESYPFFNKKTKAMYGSLMELIKREEISFYYLRHENEVVTTVAIYEGTENNGLYWVSTRMKYRKKGFANKLLNHCLSIFTKKNKNYFVLHATKKSKSLYARLGFKERDTLELFHPKHPK